MSRANVRSALTTWFAPPVVTGLNTFYSSAPKIQLASDAFAGTTPGTQSGAVGFPFIEEDADLRMTSGGLIQGEKLVTYGVGIVLHHYSTQAKAEDAMADFDALIDAVKAQVRAGRATLFGTAGTSNPLFNLGESAKGIKGTYDLPVVENGMTYLWGVVQFDVEEIIIA